MTHFDEFQSELIEEQIARLSREKSPQSMEAEVVSVLRAFYAQDAALLEQVWQRLESQQAERALPGSLPIPLEKKRWEKRNVTKQNHELHKQTIFAARSAKQRPIARLMGSLAAVLLIMLLVGGFLLVFTALRGQHISSAHSGTTTQTGSEGQGQIIYRSPAFANASTAVWSPDGSRVAVAIATGAVKNGGVNTKVESWDARTGKHLLTYLTHGDTYIADIAWSPDGTQLAVAGSSKIYLFNATTTQLVRSFSSPSGELKSALAAPLSAASPAQQMPLSSTLAFRGGAPAFEDVTWSPNGEDLAAAFNGSQNTVFVWDASTGVVRKTLTGFGSFTTYDLISKISWSPSGGMLAIQATSDQTPDIGTQLWDTATWQLARRYPKTSEMDWSPDGKLLALVDAAGNLGKDVRLVDVQSGQTIKQIAAASTIAAVHWSPDGTRIAVESQNDTHHGLPTLTLWSATSGKLLYQFPSASGVYRVAWSPDSKYLSSVENRVHDTGVSVVIWRA